MLFRILLLMGLSALTGCVSVANEPSPSIYEQLGGSAKVQEIVDNFITEIEYSPEIFPYFEHSNITRFREKLTEHLCMLTSGPCVYTGDTMAQVHGSMGITEGDFNVGVDLFINAMDKANIPQRLQNKVIAVIAPTRRDIIYQ